MNIEELTHSNYITLKPKGELDANSSLEMNQAILKQLSTGNHQLHIDCADLEYITSAGLGVFLSFMEDINQKGGKLMFSNMSTKVYDVFQLLGLHQLFTIVPHPKEVEEKMLQ